MPFLKRRKKAPAIDRETALSCRPVKLPVVKREDLPGGKARVTVMLAAPRLMRLLGGRTEVERTFGLDTLGREVYDMCDGHTNVKSMVARFARSHRLSVPEAELSVTTFVRTLMRRGMVALSSGNLNRDGKDG